MLVAVLFPSLNKTPMPCVQFLSSHALCISQRIKIHHEVEHIIHSTEIRIDTESSHRIIGIQHKMMHIDSYFNM